MDQIYSMDIALSRAPQRSGWERGGESLGWRCPEPFRQEMMLATTKQGL